MHLDRWLAAAMVLVGIVIAGIGLAGYFGTQDPLRELLLAFMVVPALPPVVLGALMFVRRRWAAPAIRAYLLLLLAVGAWLHWGVGFGVFSPPSFGGPWITAIVAWWALSYLGERRARAHAGLVAGGGPGRNF